MLAVFWALLKTCETHDFGTVSYPQEMSPHHRKCFHLLKVPLLVVEHDIDYWNLLFRTYGALKNGLEAKIPIKRGQKVIFLIFGHVDLSRSPRYYGCLYIPIRVLGCPKHNPNVRDLDFKKKKKSLHLRFF